ncbi:hypothetical protein BDR22DRAFT_649769 [Usnea florida]
MTWQQRIAQMQKVHTCMLYFVAPLVSAPPIITTLPAYHQREITVLRNSLTDYLTFLTLIVPALAKPANGVDNQSNGHASVPEIQKLVSGDQVKKPYSET